MNINIFIGPKREFEKIKPNYNFITFVDLVSQSDAQRRVFKHQVEGQDYKEKEEVINKRNCLLVQKYCYQEILDKILGKKEE